MEQQWRTSDGLRWRKGLCKQMRLGGKAVEVVTEELIYSRQCGGLEGTTEPIRSGNLRQLSLC